MRGGCWGVVGRPQPELGESGSDKEGLGLPQPELGECGCEGWGRWQWRWRWQGWAALVQQVLHGAGSPHGGCLWRQGDWWQVQSGLTCSWSGCSWQGWCSLRCHWRHWWLSHLHGDSKTHVVSQHVHAWTHASPLGGLVPGDVTWRGWVMGERGGLGVTQWS